MIELRDILVAVLAAAGAYAGVRVEIRHLWRASECHGKRITRLEDRLINEG